ncbi:MAG: hypothetical protein HY422_00145 [Candidatus Komeilibacteria bacterium]|nr:hypothetical protein [Candidatus Komeilibacteria bacterium]
MRQFAIGCVLRYLRFFARSALFIHRPLVFGIAGSVGKTSTKHALYAILKEAGRTVMTKGNSETGVPLGILGIAIEGYRPIDWLMAVLRAPFGIFNLVGVKYLIVEMGIDDPYPPKNMEYLLSIVAPDIGVFVVESAAHTEQFEKTLTAEEKKLSASERRDLLVRRITEEDMKMAREPRCHTVIYNAENTYLKKETSRLQGKLLLPFGMGRGNALFYDEHEITLGHSRFSFRTASEHASVTIRGHALPREYREVFGAAILAAREAKVSLQTINHALENNLVLPKGRSTLLSGVNGSVIIDSSYNASKASVLAFLDMVFHLKQKTGRPVVLCLGDMRELGEEAAIEHQAVAERIPGIAEYVYCVGSLTQQYIIPALQTAVLQDLRWFQSSPELGQYLRDTMPEEALVLVKGSQNTIFLEEAVKYILADKADEKKLCRQEGYWVKK